VQPSTCTSYKRTTPKVEKEGNNTQKRRCPPPPEFESFERSFGSRGPRTRLILICSRLQACYNTTKMSWAGLVRNPSGSFVWPPCVCPPNPANCCRINPNLVQSEPITTSDFQKVLRFKSSLAQGRWTWTYCMFLYAHGSGKPELWIYSAKITRKSSDFSVTETYNQARLDGVSGLGGQEPG